VVFRTLKTRQLVLDIGLAAAFFLVFAVFPGDRGGAILVTAVLAAAIAVRRLSPGLALAIAWAGALLQMGIGLEPVPSDIAVFAVLYVTAAYGTDLEFWLGFASSFAGAIAIAVYLVFALPARQGTLIPAWSDLPTALLVMIAATFGLLLAWTVGALVRTARRARANRAAQQVAEEEATVEQERVRIARDMHDVVAHSLAVVIAQADGARYAAASDPDAASTALETIATTARAALSDVRVLLTQLRHREGEGPQPTLADLDELFAQFRAAGLALRVQIEAPRDDAPAAVQLAVYRILQEALTNALRHGPTGGASVAILWSPTRVDLTVRNEVTPRPASTVGGSGHGIIGMRERAALVGGSLTAGPEAEGRFVVTAVLPIGAPA
jgi:signal transduction histidine kinase